MDNVYDISFSSYEDNSKHNSTRKGDISISDQLADFERLRIRISALSKAAEISPLVKEVTIGPNSPLKKDEYKDTTPIIEKVKPEDNLIEDKLREDLRYTLLMKQCENNIQERSEGLFKNLIANMLSKHAEVMKKCMKQAEECKISVKKKQMLEILQENDNLSVLERARIDEQNSQVVNTQTIENMNRILEEQNKAKATARFAAVTDSHSRIFICYKDIHDILHTAPLGKAACERYMPAINTVEGNISMIMDNSGTGSFTDKDVKQAEILALNIENIRTKIVRDLETLKKEEIIKKQREEELLKKKEMEEKKIDEMKAAQAAAAAENVKPEQPKKTKPVFFSTNNYNYYIELGDYLDHYEAQYKDLLQDVNLKKFRFDCQKAVNTPVNALSSVSVTHMKDKHDKLSKLLKGESVQVLDIYVTATQHPQGLAYCTALLAKKIVRQGDLLVSSNTEAAYPLAAVTVALWAQFPHFGKLVEAYFHRLCPYLVPMFLPLKEGQTDKEFYLSRGYTYNDEGVVEKQDKFLKRMSGIFRLRCAIWTAKLPKFLNTPHPQGLQYAWQWLASFINLKPEPDISATLLHDFYIMCGSTCNKSYGKQFRKILELTCTEYLKILENIDEGGPKTRLEVYLQTVLKSNDVPPPPTAAQQINW